MMELKAKGSTSIKALLVEDIEVCRLVLSTILLRLHCEVTLAMNGKEAVDLFLEGKKFDIVLFDKNMPIMTGPEAIVKIRAMGETDVKMVGVSADDHAMEAFMSVGADLFVPKPMRMEALGPIIQEVINKKKNDMV
ncbi:two-component response regulator ORR42-like [Aegilops tauschii subsp. strangulata]|uniref:Response regulatory domain-containing protein n=4 Tax=Triticinae TaxID=1648030 RepID=A0A453AHF0_AEGTS|nr:two-component response regulator ORR42-like [Aegilops tauschii subsp. strangulata]XP_040256814.1 two-component response regulator ORR42-like [Aegilops tauschii subsp. strangulata]XP_045089675.1 two-component response regulator ORR42-like [Aegilops tauschii subsp. strangulata]